jgi:hypothetical protein
MSELQSASYSPVQIIRIQNASLRYLRERARGDRIPNRLSEEIKSVAETHSIAISSCDSMIDRATLLRQNISMAHSYRDDELFGAMLVEAYEALDAAS